MAITLHKDVEDRLIGSIRRYFSENMEEEIGDLKARLLLDFCLREIGPSVYNAAVTDAQRYLQEKAADMEVSVYESEFGYWKKARP